MNSHGVGRLNVVVGRLMFRNGILQGIKRTVGILDCAAAFEAVVSGFDSCTVFHFSHGGVRSVE